MLRLLLLLLITLFVIPSAFPDNNNNNSSIPIVQEPTSCHRRFVNANGRSITEYYQCPDNKTSDSPEKTQCCDIPGEKCCVAPKTSRFQDYELPLGTAIIIAIAAVLAAALITGVMIACCCWEKCPLYMACRAEAKLDYIAKPEDVAGLSLMPDDNMDDAKIYEPGKASSVYMRC